MIKNKHTLNLTKLHQPLFKSFSLSFIDNNCLLTRFTLSKQFSSKFPLLADNSERSINEVEQGSSTQETSQIEESEQKISELVNELENLENRIERATNITNSKFNDVDHKIEATKTRLDEVIDSNINSLSDETSNLLSRLSDKQVEDREKIDSLMQEDPANVDSFAYASRLLDIGANRSVANAMLDDPALPLPVSQQISDLLQDNKSSGEDVKLCMEYLKELDKEKKEFKDKEKELEQQEKQLEELENKEDNRSVVDDFADVNAEMPSYMDPED